MRCEDVRSILDDYVDGTLSDGESHQVDEHVAACAECRRETEALRALLEKTAALSRSILPERDLWRAIEPALAANSTPFIRKPRQFIRRWPVPLAVAAALLVGLALFLARILIETSRPAPGPSAAATDALDAQVRDAEAEYAWARDELHASFVQHRDNLPPDTRRVIEENLAIIDNAVADIRAALVQDTDNVRLFRMLVAAENQGLAVLRLAAKLSEES